MRQNVGLVLGSSVFLNPDVSDVRAQTAGLLRSKLLFADRLWVHWF